MVRRHHTVAVKEKMTAKSLIVGFNFVFANPIILGTITLDLFAVLLGEPPPYCNLFQRHPARGPYRVGPLAGCAASRFVILCSDPGSPPASGKGGARIALGGSGVWPGYNWVRLFASFLVFFDDALCLRRGGHISVVVRHTLVQLLTPDENEDAFRRLTACLSGHPMNSEDSNPAFVAHLLVQWFLSSRRDRNHPGRHCVGWIWPQIRKYGRLG